MPSNLKPLIAVVGTTGVGKSKLAVDLALHLNSASGTQSTEQRARIINGDAMQVYKGLDILTNKMTKEEQCGIPHHLMGFQAPEEQYLVTDWIRDATICITNAHENGEVPIIVGGTAYWIQNLIFSSNLASLPEVDYFQPLQQSKDVGWDPELIKRTEGLIEELKALWMNLPIIAPHPDQAPDESFKLHELLTSLDSVTAARWHWRDSRRVLTSLRVIKESGKTVGEVHSNQVVSARYRALIIWVYSEQKVLHPRLNGRVDDMIKNGLLDEVKELIAIGGGGKQDTTSSIFQSIGYKEFEGYLTTQQDADGSPERKMLFAAAKERMKTSTRQYARRQIQWLKNKLLPVVNKSADVSMYIVKVEDAKTWDSEPKLDAILRMEVLDFLSSKPLDDQDLSEFLELSLTRGPDASDKTKKICTICTRDNRRPIMIEEGNEWDKHVKTRRHKEGIKQTQKRDSRKQMCLSQHSPSTNSDGAESGTSLIAEDVQLPTGILHS